MKVTVTQLKAPWPAGTEVGDVVELEGCDAIPAWATNKCTAAADDAKAAHVWRKPGAADKPATKAKADKPAAEAEAKA
jgi:hypothetical protein